MRILLTNDDGVCAEGIAALKHALEQDHEITTVAPLEQRSGTGHGLTMHDEITVRKVAERTYGVSGLPADCTLVGMIEIMKDNPPDLIISGINNGANLGLDIYYSGTVAAAREATIRGLPAISVSLTNDFCNCDTKNNHYETAAKFVSNLVKNGVKELITDDHLLNINVPNVPVESVGEIELTALGRRNFKTGYHVVGTTDDDTTYLMKGGLDNYLKKEGTDCIAIEKQNISLTPLNVLTMSADNLDAWRNFIGRLTL